VALKVEKKDVFLRRKRKEGIDSDRLLAADRMGGRRSV